MRLFVTLLAGFALAGQIRAQDLLAKPNTLTQQEITDGWLLLFDGETTFGWSVEGEASVIGIGELVLGGTKKTTATVTTSFGFGKLEYDSAGTGMILGTAGWVRTDGELTAWEHHKEDVDGVGAKAHPPLRIEVPAGKVLKLRNVKFRPNTPTTLFNGKDLTGWRKYTGDAARSKSRITVTPEGWLNVKDGPGDLQTEGQWADFVLQLECISNGPHLNSGVFFRCLPKQYQQGYEAQIRNQWEGNDRTKPVDYGTGAIYRRQPARKVVSSDHEWFTMTVVAHGIHVATWVNGYQVTDFTDTRQANENARNGSKTGAGCLSIQGHDPTTDLSFRNIRIAELAGEKK